MSGLLSKIGAAITAYPESWDDYVGVGRWMIYKKLLVMIGILLPILLIVAIVILIHILQPEIEPEPEPPGIPVFHYFDDLLKLHTGEAVILDRRDRVIYRGRVENGLRSGWGRSLSPPDEILIYQGEFRFDQYSGQGSHYDQTGVLLYRGGFDKGVYNGTGVQYHNEEKRYEGSFADGLPHGEGVEYDGERNIRYTGSFARGNREGIGMETDPEGFPVYEGGFRLGKYDGQGRLYTSGGGRLVFEGTFLLGRPAREGKIFNLQGQLLYEGSVFDGKVDCVNLLGRSLDEWLERVSESPVTYFADGYAGLIYCDLGIAAIVQYDRSLNYADPQTDDDHSGHDNADPVPAPDGSLLIRSMLLEGDRYHEQIPVSGIETQWDEISGFEWFMASRLAAIQNPTAMNRVNAITISRGDNLYEVIGLPEKVPFDGHGIYKNRIFYMWNDDLSKGGVQSVIHLRKAQFGG